jgi:beta-lactam-binding protein with PASTA domain
VVGDTQAQAETALQAQNLTAVVVCEPTSVPAQDGIVQTQTPQGGQPVPTGSSVTITVASFSGCAGTTTTTGA